MCISLYFKIVYDNVSLCTFIIILFYFYSDQTETNTIQNLALAATEFERRYHISVDTPETDKGDPTRKKVKIKPLFYKIGMFLLSSLFYLFIVNIVVRVITVV